MNYRNTPFLRIIIPFALGILLGDSFPPLDTFMQWVLTFTALVVLVTTATLKYAPRFNWLFGLLMPFSVGALAMVFTWAHQEHYAADHFSRLIPDTPTPVQIEGFLYDMPIPGAKTKARIAVHSIEGQPCSGNVLAYIAADSLRSDTLLYGDVVRISCARSPASCPPPANPHAFDYSNYLHHQNIHYTLYAHRHEVEILQRGRGNPVWAMAFSCRGRLLSVLHRYFPDTDEYAVASALLVGYKEDLSDEIKTAYAETGSMHALAVSGTHVGLLYVGVLFFLNRLPLRGRKGRITEALLALLAIWIFTFITGASASVLRASVMFSFHLVGKMIYRQSNIWNVLSASAFCLLLYNPFFLFDAGFLLSYSAVAGMAFFYPLLYKISPAWSHPWIDEAWKVLLVGVAAQTGTLPLSLYYFHQFPVYFWLSGWVVVLGGAIFLWAGTLLLVLDALWPWAASWLGWALSWMLSSMNGIIFWIQDLPGSVWSGIWIGIGGVIILYAGIMAGGAAWALKQGRWILVSLSLMWLLLTTNAFRDIAQCGQKRLYVYSIHKATLIDLMDDQHCLSLGEGVNARQELFAAQANRWACGVSHLSGQWIPLAKDTVAGSWQTIAGWIQCDTFLMAILTRQGQPLSDSTLHINAVLLTDSPKISLSECMQRYHPQVIVADNRNTWRTLQRWQEEAEANAIPFWNIRERGAWEKIIAQ